MEYLAGRTDDAVASLRHALQLNPSLFTPVLFLGKAYNQAGKPALAFPYLSRANTLHPNDPEALLTLAKTTADLQRPREARLLYANAVHLAPEIPGAWLGLGVTSLEVITADGGALAASHPQSVWARALYADELLAQGRPIEATDTYKVASVAASPVQRSTLARMLQWMQFHPDLYPLTSNSQEALQPLRAQIESEQGKTESPECPDLSEPDTSSAQVAGVTGLLQRAACAYWKGDYEQSAEPAAQALRLSPQNAEALYWSVKANERIAVAALARFEQLAPHSAASYVMVGDLFRQQRQPDSALEEYKKALMIDAHDPAALAGAVAAAISAQKLDEAQATAEIALIDRPLDPQLNLFMAEILAQNNQYDQMRPFLAKCLGGPPQLQFRVHFLLGRADQEDGKPEDAIRQFELALPGDTDGSIHYQLLRLYRKTGHLAEAQKAEAETKALIKRRDANAAVVVREALGRSQ
jgi:tetratricopeptide (TPR) repeat protein